MREVNRQALESLPGALLRTGVVRKESTWRGGAGPGRTRGMMGLIGMDVGTDAPLVMLLAVGGGGGV